MTIEACVETLDEAIIAEHNGANILELCSRLDLDGLTPDRLLIEQVLENVKIPVKVMIRSRPGNFVYNNTEIRELENIISTLENLPIDGYVVGALDQDNNIDVSSLNKIIRNTDKTITFHKAIDLCPEIFKAMRTLMTECEKVKYILSSGSQSTAIKGSATLQKMVEESGSKITIIPAGKITYANLSEVHDKISATHYHGRKIVPLL
jgi:copper homeostasis protein